MALADVALFVLFVQVIQAPVAIEVDVPKISSKFVDRSLKWRLRFVVGEVHQPALAQCLTHDVVRQSLDNRGVLLVCLYP